MKAKYLIILLFAGLLSSCSTIRKTSDSVAVMTPVSTYPTVADLRIAPERVSKTITWKWNPFATTSLSTKKANTTAELIQEAGADVLIEPEYIEQTSWLDILGGSLTVSGYPATFENFRKATAEDLEALKIVESHKGQCQGKDKNKKKRFLIF